ncbi:MAG: glycosyltransferase family 39 protein [Acidimicrobiia bacterium]|nr:glycosyltransferase family 39 protein [Acidimicrobiia bacterium]
MRRRTVIALGAVTVVAAALRLWNLAADPFWLDEAHTADFTTLPVGELWSFSKPFDTVNPPGFILLMKIWTQLSRSDPWFRLLPAIAGILTVPVVYAAGTRLANRHAGLYAAAYVAVSGFLVRYSQEARAYALVALLVSLALWSVAQLVAEPDGDSATPLRRSPRPERLHGQGLRRQVTWTDVAWPVYAVAAGLGLHLHNTAVGLALASNVAIGIWWLGRRPEPRGFARNWVLANIGAFLVWSPWFPGFLAQLGLVQQNFWVTPPTPSSVIRDIGVVFDAYASFVVQPAGSTVFHAVLLALMVTGVWWGTRRLDRGPKLIIWSFLLVQPLFELAFSLRQPVFLSRTLLWIALAAAIGLGAASARGGWLGRVTSLTALAVALVSVAGYHTSFEKSAWDEAAELVASEASPDDVVFILAGNTQVAFDHYFDRDDVREIALPFRIPGRQDSGATLTERDIAAITEIVDEHARTWLVLNSVANIQNGASLPEALDDHAARTERYEFYDVVVVAFD